MSVICECTFFEEGDWVECKLNSEIFGIIINESDFGRYYTVQLAGSLETKVFHFGTIRHMDEFDEEVPPSKIEPSEGDNVIYAKFGAHTETKGAA